MNTDQSALTLTLIPAELEKAIEGTALAVDSKQTLRDCFAPHFIKFHELAESAAQIAVNAPKAAREKRLELKAVRVASEHTRRMLKDDILIRGRAIDSINAILELQCSAIEDRLDKIEKAEEIAAEERKAAIKAKREAELATLNVSGQFYDLANMPEADWLNLFNGIVAQQKAIKEAGERLEAQRIEAEKKAMAERARIAAEEAAEREKIRLENERLKKEAAARDKAAKEEAFRQAQAREIERRKEAAARAELEAKAAAERAELQRKADEQAAIARKEAEQLRAAQEAEVARRRKIEAELAAERAAIAKKKADEQKAAKKAAAAPDKQKLTVFVNEVAKTAMPLMTTDEGRMVASEIAASRDAFATWAAQQIAKL